MKTQKNQINYNCRLLSAILLLVLLFNINLSAQETQQKPQTTQAENPQQQSTNPVVQPPLELPTFIIEGIEQLNIKAGMKQFPSPPTVLSQKELDSINPLEKQQSLLVAPPQLPKTQELPKFANGFLQAKAGMFSTFDLLAGYGAKFEGYELYGRVGFLSSSGDVKNSNFNKFFINLNSDYIAPEFFWIFGGSRTRTQASYGHSSFSQYGTFANLSRSTNNFDISLVSDGNYEGVNFSTGAGFNTFNLDQTVRGVKETRINGFLNINQLLENNAYGISADLNFGTFQGKTLNLLQFSGTGAIYKEKITLDGEAGYQIASASNGENQSTFFVRANISYLPNLDYSIRAEFFTGLEKSYFADYFQRNMYFDDFSNLIYFPRANAIIRGILQYLPHNKVGITLTGALKFYDKYPFFNSTDTNTIELLFEKASIIKANAEGFYEITQKDRINGMVGFNVGILNYKDNSIPYLPGFEATVSYARKWFDVFKTEFGVLYNSKRYADKDNKYEINSYFNLFFKADYNINNKFKIIAELNNLTNSDNFVWKGYKERGAFGSIGINWQF